MGRIKGWGRVPLLGALLMSLFIMITLVFFSHHFPYSSDSARYIEQAREMLLGNGAIEAPFGLNGEGKAPSALFPVGFPVFLYLIGLLGIDPKDSAIYVGRVSATLLPLLVFIGFKRILHANFAVMLAILVALSPSVLANAPLALTDIPALFIALAAAALLFNTASVLPFVMAGMLVACGYGVRNAHLALIVTTILYFILCYVIFKPERARTIKLSAAFFGGVVAIALPLLVRNYFVFGNLSPYKMGQSTIGLVENVRTYINTITFDVTALQDLSEYIAWSIPGLAIILLIALTYVYLATLAWRKMANNEKKVFLFCALYVAIGSAVVIVARTRYQWGEGINIRHTLQYTPFALAMLFLASKHFIAVVGPFSWRRVYSSGLVPLLMMALIVTHVYHAITYFAAREEGNEAMLAYNTGEAFLCNRRQDVLLVSNWAFVFRMQCLSPVRHLGHVNSQRDVWRKDVANEIKVYDTLMDGVRDIDVSFPEREIVAGFLPGRHGVEASDLPVPESDATMLHNMGWTIYKNDKNALIIGRQRKSPGRG